MTALLKKIKIWHLAVIVMAILFIPFPTELVPEWKMQFRKKDGTVAAGVVAEQSWRSYSFSAGGYDQRCTDQNGEVTFPRRDLWSGMFSRLVSPLLAEVGSLAHGSTGTSANVRVFDANYISPESYYWRDQMSLYTHRPGEIPTEGKAGSIEFRADSPTCRDLK